MRSILSSAAILLLLVFTIVINGCKDDEVVDPLTLFDVNITVEENQEDGATLDFITASSTAGPVMFSIASQEPAGALLIDGTTGELTVDDGSLFNYEVRTFITAVIAITDGVNDGSIDVRITLEDTDDIEYLLSTSKTDYQNAANGIWVEITGPEYFRLEAQLLEVTMSATSAADWEGMFMPSTTQQNYTIANNNGHTLPTGSYLFGFKYVSMLSAAAGNKVLLSQNTVNGTYSVIGSPLQAHGTGNHYYVLKGNDTPTSATGYLGYYFSNKMGYRMTTGSFILEPGFTLNLSGTEATNVVNLYQGLSTTVKQW